MPEPSVDRRVGRYEIVRQLGRGGMAVVYLARQPDLDRNVALKELSSFQLGSPESAERFLRESRLAGSLSHPNIVTVHEYFEQDGIPYIAMEYVPRGSLRPYVGRLTLAQLAGVLEGILAGLAHAEQSGIVHRDLKPENLMVTGEGRVKITDFGIAKATQSVGMTAALTATGSAVGTPTYMAPEQAMAQPVGPWTDLYSVGVMTYEHLTGRPPFDGAESPMVMLMRHVNDPVTPLIEVMPDVDRALSDWVDRLLVKDPSSRTQGAIEAWDALEEIVIHRLGPRWRRGARLDEPSSTADTTRPLTPAPFETKPSEAPREPESGFVTFDPHAVDAPAAAPRAAVEPPRVEATPAETAPAEPALVEPVPLEPAPSAPEEPAMDEFVTFAATPTPDVTEPPGPEGTTPPEPEVTEPPVPEVAAPPVPEVAAPPVPDVAAPPVPDVAAPPEPVTPDPATTKPLVRQTVASEVPPPRQPVTLPPPAAPPAPTAPKRPHRAVILAVVAIVAVAAAVVVALIAGGGSSPHTGTTAASSTTTTRSTPLKQTQRHNALARSSAALSGIHSQTFPGGITVRGPIALTTGGTPAGLVVVGRDAWVTDTTNNLLVLVREDGSELRIPVGHAPADVTGDRVTGRLYVANEGSGDVTVLDRFGSVIRRPVKVGSQPSRIAVGNQAVWVVDSGDTAITRIDPNTFATMRIELGSTPTALGNHYARVWVAKQDRTLTVLDPDGSLNGSVPQLPGSGTPVSISASNGVWVLRGGSGLTRVDPRVEVAVRKTKPYQYTVHPDSPSAGADPREVAGLDGQLSDNTIWVLSTSDHLLSRIGTLGPNNNKVLARIPLGSSPERLAVYPGVVWVDDPRAKALYEVIYQG